MTTAVVVVLGNVKLYYGIFHGSLEATGKEAIFWTYLSEHTEPPLTTAPKSDIRAWLIKNNFSSKGYTLGLKKH